MKPDQLTARAACEAGYLPLPDYLEMCRRYGWETKSKRPTGWGLAFLISACLWLLFGFATWEIFT